MKNLFCYITICIILYPTWSISQLDNRSSQHIDKNDKTLELIKKQGTYVDTSKIIENSPQPTYPVEPEDGGGQNKENADPANKKEKEQAIASYYAAIRAQNKASQQINDSLAAYYAWAFKNREKVLLQQQKTSSIIFYMVLLLVLCGLIFSGIQFYIAFSGSKKRIVVPDTSIKASLTGVEVSSSLLGILLLTLSLAFFYLYLVKVYPLVSIE